MYSLAVNPPDGLHDTVETAVIQSEPTNGPGQRQYEITQGDGPFVVSVGIRYMRCVVTLHSLMAAVSRVDFSDSPSHCL